MTPTMAQRLVHHEVAVVTGAARGIGRAIAQELIKRGYSVVITDIDEVGVAATAELIGAVASMAHDVRDPRAHERVAAAAAAHGPLTVWVNNAGVGYDGTLRDLTDQRAEALVDINFKGPMWGMRAALGALGPQGGDILNMASLSGHGPVPGLSVYAATKAAVVSLSASVNCETDRKVRVHAFCPDGVDTQLVDDMNQDGRARALIASGGRLLTPQEAAEAAVDMIGTRRVVRTVPAWRGGMMRLSNLAPGPLMALEPVMRLEGKLRMRFGRGK